MRKKYLLISVSLLISLFIYLFYRTSHTLVNAVLIRLISLDSYRILKADIVSALPLNNVVIYSLPEGLWIFCITLTSKPYYFKLYNRRIDCIFIPLIFCVGLEFLQLLHITNGRFDWMDIGASVLFWLLGCYTLDDRSERQNVFSTLNSKMLVCLGSYAIVYLAHVFK